MLTISVRYRIISDMPCPECDKKCHNHDYGVYYVICLKSIVHCPEYYSLISRQTEM
ncbi:MAG: hypothetical protein IKN91_09300 [Paludibacteraceae bacterium]|nr:hypothetical protein [Paludibacteraceae bacterium]